VVYGVIVTVVGITDSPSAIDKAQGVNINLWTGIGMLVLGLLFLLWMKLSPPPPPPAAQETPEPGSHRPGDGD
jgi:xanthine/uracil/vitamin C permease (AzgA family)